MIQETGVLIPGRVIPRSQKMVLEATLFITQHYKVRIKGEVDKSRKWVVPSPTPLCRSYWKWSLGSLSSNVTNFTYLLLWEIFFFTKALADGFSLELEWQKVSSSLQDSSQYSGRSQQCYSVKGLGSFSDFQLLWSLWSATSTDIPDPHSPLLPIVHRIWQVLRATSRILTELLYLGSSWSPCFCSAMWGGPLKNITYELVPASPTVSCMSGSSNLDSFRDGKQVAVYLLLCGVLSPGLIQYCFQHSCVIAVKLFLHTFS